MPTASDNLAAYIPRRGLVFQNTNPTVFVNAVRPMTVEQFTPFKVEPPPGTQSTTPRKIEANLDEIEEAGSENQKTSQRRRRRILLSLLALLATAIIGVAIAIPIVLNRTAGSATSTTINIGSSISLSSTTTVTTTTANCISPYVLSSSGTCVNVLIDIHNCGSLSHNCSSNYTSCSGGVCSAAPAVQLQNSNFIWTAAINGSVDDNFFGVQLPMNITFYNTTTNFLYVTTNGVICLGSCASTFTETTLPTSAFPGVTILPYWDDLYIYASTSQGIYYAAQGNSPNRTLTFEFYMSHFQQPQQYYHYQVIFFESLPNIVQFKYFDASDGGISCTVGVQASSSGPFIQYSFDLANSVRSNMSLTFNTNRGTYTNSTF